MDIRRRRLSFCISERELHSPEHSSAFAAHKLGHLLHHFLGLLKLLHELEGKENRKAQFRTAISLILDGKEYLFEGVIKGEIIREKRGDSGFGYDPVFKPEGYERTFAELGNDVKNKISHRALAVQKLCEFLQS